MNTLHPIEKYPHGTTEFIKLNILSFFRTTVVIDGVEVEIDAIKTDFNKATPYPLRKDLPPTISVDPTLVVLHLQGPVVLSIDSGVIV